mgnify:CR=1 FL=1
MSESWSWSWSLNRVLENVPTLDQSPLKVFSGYIVSSKYIFERKTSLFIISSLTLKDVYQDSKLGPIDQASMLGRQTRGRKEEEENKSSRCLSPDT